MNGHRSGKRPWLAAVLAFIYPGLGHAYLREWLRALLWFGLMYTTIALAIPESALPESGAAFSIETVMQLAQSLSIEATLALFVLSVLNIVDAYRLARQGNQPSTTDDERDRCPHCGRETDPEFEFCQWCSEPLDTNAESAG